jgi:hypothetical protein
MKKQSIFLILVTLVFHIPLHANNAKYCADEGRKIDFHLFGFTYQSELLKKTAKKAVTDIKAKFARGDKVRIFSHEKKGYSITFDSCLPGCPEVGFIDGFFSSECSNTVAKRDRIGFERQFATGVLKNFQTTDEPYEIFSAVQQLNDAYRIGVDGIEVYAVISLVPHNVNPKDRKQLNKLLRVANETLKIPKTLPPVEIVGAASDEQLVEFWKIDIFKKSQFTFYKY